MLLKVVKILLLTAKDRKRNPVGWRSFWWILWLFLTPLKAEILPVKIYTAADGIGSSFTSHLMRDSRGFMWFCTRDGLSRFDGQRFITYQIGTRDAPPGIEYIYETGNGIYWITTTGGLYRYDPAKAAAIVSKNNDRPVLNAEFVHSQRGNVYEDKTGKLWFLSDGLFLLEETDGKVSFRRVELSLPENPLLNLSVSKITETADGSFWITTSWGLVRRLPDGREVFYSAEPGTTDGTFSIAVDGAGRVWLANSSGVYVIKPEPLAELKHPENLVVRPLNSAAPKVFNEHQASPMPEKAGEIFKFVQMEGAGKGAPKLLYKSFDGHLWISMMSGVVEFDGQKFHRFTGDQGFIGGVGVMGEDLNHNLWIGGPGGLLRLNRQGLTTYNLADGLKSLNILVLNEDRDGSLTAVSNDFFVSRLVGDKLQTIRPFLPPKAKALWTSNPVFRDSRNDWWILTTERLFRFRSPPDFALLDNRKADDDYDTSDNLRGNQMFHIFEDSRGAIWLSTRSVDAAQFGLSRWNPQAEEKFYTFSPKENFPEGKSATAYAEDSAGRVWLGFYEGGLMRYEDGRFTEIAVDNNLLDGVITGLYFDKKGRLWIATALNGLSRLDDLTATHPQLINFNTGNGLASNNARSVTEDEFGRIYVGTARGVDRITPENGHIRHYSTSDGLAGDFVQAAFRDSRGLLWFGTPNGISRLVPVEEQNSTAPLVWISGLRVAGEIQPIPELGAAQIAVSTDLAPEQNNLQIDFFGIDYNPSRSLRYQYMLEGADADWNTPTDQRTVNYSNLSAGNYRFMVRAVNAEGGISNPPAEISFKILPPIWKRWWFIALVIIIVGAGLFAFYRYRLAKLKAINAALRELQKSREERLAELERVRSRIARDLHDDVGASLTQISLYSEVAKQREKEKVSAQEPLQFLVNLSNELVEAMSDIVWAINPRKDHLHDLTQRMRYFAAESFNAANIELDFIAPTADEDVPVGANLRREVFLIFKESVNNIIKHSAATHAEIGFLLEKNVLILHFKDNGQGFKFSESNDFDWEKARGGNGLLNMRKRARELGGEYRIESEIGKGTHITLTIPLGE